MNDLETLLSERRILRILWNYKKEWLIRTDSPLTYDVKQNIEKLYNEIVKIDKKIADYIERANLTIYTKGGTEIKLNGNNFMN